MVTLVVASALAAAGCSATPFVAARPMAASPDLPANVSHAFGTFERGDAKLFWQRWRPVDRPPRATVVLIHGFKDHSSRYQELALALVAGGFAVHAMDQRGHGRSSGERTAIASYDDLVADLALYMQRVKAAEPGQKVFLFGHSMGGVVVTLYALDHGRELAGLMLSAPALRVDRLPLEVAAIPVVGTLAPKLALLTFPNAQFSRVPAVVAEMSTDPLIHDADGPASTAVALADAIGRIWARAHTLAVPLLAMHGTADQLTDPRGSAALVARAADRRASLRLYPGLVHDLVHEPERKTLFTDVLGWLNLRLQEDD